MKICNVQITFLIARGDIWADKLPGSLIRDKDNGIVNKQASTGKRDSDSFLPHFSKTILKQQTALEVICFLLHFFLFFRMRDMKCGYL